MGYGFVSFIPEHNAMAGSKTIRKCHISVRLQKNLIQPLHLLRTQSDACCIIYFSNEFAFIHNLKYAPSGQAVWVT